jgi:hypothetical protein
MHVLQKEMEVYRANLAQLREANPQGGFVVIKGDLIFGVWNDRGDALSAGIKEFGNVSFLVKGLEDAGRKFQPFRPSFERLGQ